MLQHQGTVSVVGSWGIFFFFSMFFKILTESKQRKRVRFFSTTLIGDLILPLRSTLLASMLSSDHWYWGLWDARHRTGAEVLTDTMIQWEGTGLCELGHLWWWEGKTKNRRREASSPSLHAWSKQDSNKNLKFHGFTKPKRQAAHALPRLAVNAQAGSLGIQ